MKMKAVGSILLILGTSIGAGMLALPIAMAPISLWLSCAMLLICWLVMTAGALCLLEANLWLSPSSNLISMSYDTLGAAGRLVSWLVYLVLLYSLLCAYLSGTGDVLQSLLLQLHWVMPRGLATLLSLLLLGSVVWAGVGSVDQVNRGLMTVKLVAYALLVVMIAPHIHLSYLRVSQSHFHISILMVVATSFGYAIIVPTLRAYLDSDVGVLKRVILIGSLLPLFLYLIWTFAIQGVIPRLGSLGLFAMAQSAHTNSLLMQQVSHSTAQAWLVVLAKLFVSICVMTSFLGVSVCLVDFIADGLQWSRKGRQGAGVFAISYLPPLLIVLFDPGIFLKALSYAGICCVILLILLPALMVYIGRYVKQRVSGVILPGGRVMLGAILLMGLMFLILNFLQ